MSAKSPRAAALPEQRFTVPCDCERKGSVTLGHYEIARCPKCNCQFWALQPDRGGPLVLKPWPGPNFTRQEMEGKAA